jgi:hypothetical protein
MKNSPACFRPLALLVLLTLVFTGCADTKMTTAWTAPAVGSIQFKKVFILGLNPRDDNRRMAEVAVRDIITKIPVTCSFELLPEVGDIMIKDKVVKAVADSGADGVIALRLISSDTAVTYSADSAMVMGYEFFYTDSSNPNTAVPFYQNSASIYTNRVFAIEVGIYDVKAKKLIWKGQSQTVKEATNPGDVNSIITEVAETVRAKLQSQQLIR